MRVDYAVLLTAAAFLASANAASVTTPTFDRSLTAAQRDVTAQLSRTVPLGGPFRALYGSRGQRLVGQTKIIHSNKLPQNRATC
ncbi:hypothetical protein PF005_g26023 [Phytophthora fragariae]|uniref:RxLR effector protein n=1 Tax=Phytophthora fragariae TaxID=53985 RepID=A0A6A3IJT2_9STRA|nr:hypothetical protein PF003_g35592 [Phytophthora fragariae]KAE8928573.1 hypothetical protein PF009_g21288 [Phytophthora fragariae]KAE8982340.1 hypothetical protein PF011_g21657 [Phytophthora fragariae]KAE9072364.1 hypothetical protein PF010_g25515 [Phytophthora fragariae]KAE9083063.1 hypothetical protein PF007_g22057 [Phytophthora fragariae]